MKISQKLTLGFAVIVTPITLFSVFTLDSVRKELKEVRDLRNSNLHFIQNTAASTERAVEKSFAYFIHGEEIEKSAFLSWAKNFDSVAKNLQKLGNSVSNKDVEEKEAYEEILLTQVELVEKADQLFNEFGSKGSVTKSLFLEYEGIVDRQLANYKKVIKIEELELETKQYKTIMLIEQTMKDINTLGLLTIILTVISCYFIARSISSSINKLKLATVELARGNLDTKIELQTNDEIGDFAVSFSHMTVDLKKAREDLMSVKNYINNIIKSMSDTLIVVSPGGTILTVNDAICNLLRYEENELIGQAIDKIVAEAGLLRERELNLTKTGVAQNTEKVYLSKDGGRIPMSFSSSVMHNGSEQVQGIVCVAQDITERKQAEADIRNALEKEKELGELKSRFVSMTSHEFRTPLATILSSAELLEHYSHKWAEERKLQHLQRIQTAVINMTQLLNDVLLIGKAEAGKLEFKPVLMDLVQFCRDLVEEIQLSAIQLQNESSTHAIAFVSQGRCTNAYMDEKLLRHILSNLLSNAIKYSPQGGSVHFDLVCELAEATFRIRDEGIGIPAADQAQLFNSFHRASNVGTISGTGLGLSIVKKAVDLHGGKITVESEVGVGTTFTVTLSLNHSV